MAKVITRSVDKPNLVKRRRELAMLKDSRADQETNIGEKAKTYLDSFFTALNDSPSMKGTYFSIHTGETTFSEFTNSQKSVEKATKFNKIEDFVMWGQKNAEEIDNKGDEERENAIDATEQECVVLQGTIRPLKGDHFVFESQGTEAVVYMVTNVKSLKLIDKPIYNITLNPSTTFDRTTIEENVIDTYKFIFGNIGTQRKTILLKETYHRLSELNDVVIEMNDMYVDAFYDVKYDLLRLEDGDKFYGCKALREFQHDKELFTWGNDMNTLFVGYPFVTKKDTADYKRSYISSIARRKLVPYNTTEDYSLTGAPNLSGLLSELYSLRDDINEDNLYSLEEGDEEELSEYVPKYDNKFKFYVETRSDYSILMNLRKSGKLLYELNSLSKSGRTKSATDAYVVYEPTSKIFRKLIDLWQDKDFNSIINTTLLDDYIVSNNNIDDYLMIPIIMYILTNTMASIENDDMVVSF